MKLIIESASYISSLWKLPRDDRDDLIQELSLLGLKLSRKGYHLGYIRRSMRNRSLNYLKARKNGSFEPLDVAINVPMLEKDCLSETLQIEEARKILSSVSNKLLDLLWEGQTITDAANALEIPRRTATRIISQIRRMME